MRMNPEELQTGQAQVLTDPADKKPFVQAKAAEKSTTLAGGQLGDLLPLIGEEEEAPDIIHGVGTMRELETRLTKEDELVPYVYEGRLKGQRIKEAPHYPKVPFDYSIEKVGTRRVDDRSVGYSLRVDAHPQKLIEGELTHEMRMEKEQSFEAELEINTTAPRSEYRSRIRWDGVKEVMTHSDVKDIFVSKSTIHVTGKGKTATWQKKNGQVIDLKNAAWFSGVISGTHVSKTHYEAEFEFTPTYTTEQKYNIVRRVTKGYKVVKPSGHSSKKYWDDDLVGMIFKAKSNRDFYVLLWESDERLGRSSRVGDISGRHITDEELFIRDTVVSPVGPGMTSISKKKWDDYTKKKGWGTSHARVYRVVNGVFHKVSLKDKRSAHDGWTFGVRQGMRVVSQGKRVKLYLKTTSKGGWKLAFEFDSAYEAGSFGMCNISQAVLFHKIRYVENQKISGVIPSSGWHRTKRPSVTLTSDTMGFVGPYAKRAAGGKKYEVLHVKAEEDPKTAKTGSVTVHFPKGGITIKTRNPDPTKLRTYKFTETGSFNVLPDKNSPSRSIVAFDGALKLFKAKLDKWQKNHTEQKIVDYDFDLIHPTMKGDDDWDLVGANNEKLIFWNSNVKEETVRVSIPIYAYEGKVEHSLDEWFSLNPYSTASFDVDEKTYDRWHDEFKLRGGGESLRLEVQTSEWYKGVQAEHLRLYGTVSSKSPLRIPMPAMPEHYVHPTEEGPMYHGHEIVRYTLLQMKPVDNTAFATFDEAGDATTEQSNEINKTTGRPLVMTDSQLDTIYVKAKPDPRLVPWRSGAKTGSTSVNGVRPFLSAAKGKQDMSIGIKELLEPEDLASIDRVEVKTNDARINYQLKGSSVLFYSDYESNYRYATAWRGPWVKDSTPRFASRFERTIHDGLILEPETTPGYDSSVIIEGIEAQASTPFVLIEADEEDSTARGLVGRYHQKPSSMRVKEERITLEGSINSFEQSYHVASWLKTWTVEIPYNSTLMSVSMDGELLTENDYSLVGEQFTIVSPALKAGELVLKYVTGEIKRNYPMTELHGETMRVYLGSNLLSDTDYTVDAGRITLAEAVTLKENDTITIRSIDVATPYTTTDKALGQYVGARIDDEIWYDWGLEGPFPLVNTVTPQALEYHEATVEATIVYDEEVEVFVEEASQWRQYDVAVKTDTVNYGSWAGTSQGYDDLTILTNGQFTAKLSPLIKGARVGISSHVMMQSLDDDAAGLILQSPDKVTSFVFAWDTNGTSYKGMKIQKWTCLNPLEEGSVVLKYAKTTLFEKGDLFGVMDPNAPGNMSSVAEHDMKMILDKRQQTITAWADGVQVASVPVGDLVSGDFSVGVFGESQPITRYRDIVTIEEKWIQASDDRDLRQVVTGEIEPPVSTDMTNQFEYPIQDVEVYELFRAAVLRIKTDKNIKDTWMSYQITSSVSTGSVYFDETMNSSTIKDSDKVMVLVKGVAAPIAPPVLLPKDTTAPPNIPNESLPPTSLVDAFAIEWTGKLIVEKTGTHVFEIVANDSVILEVDGQKIFESFGMIDGQPREARINLVGGTNVRFRLRYYENKSYAYVRLRMKEPGRLMRRIPKERFLPYEGYMLKSKKSVQYPEPWALQVKAGDMFFGREERHLYATEKTETLTMNLQGQIVLTDVPRQGAPIYVSRGGVTYRETALIENGNKGLYQSATFAKPGSIRGRLTIRNLDKDLITVRRNGILEPFEVEGQGVLFVAPIQKGEIITVRYADPLTFFVESVNGALALQFAENVDPQGGPFTVVYEGQESPWHVTDLHINPVRSRREEMAFYEVLPTGEPALLLLKLSQDKIEANENSRIVATVKVEDALGNAMEATPVTIEVEGVITTLTTDDAGIARKVLQNIGESTMVVARTGVLFDVRTITKGAGQYRLQVRQSEEKAFAEVENIDGTAAAPELEQFVFTSAGMVKELYKAPIDLPIGKCIVIMKADKDMTRIATQWFE